MRQLHVALLGATLLTTPLMGCGGDSFSYDSASYYPESWRASYVKKKDCAPSPTHGGDHVEVWVSPDAVAAFDDPTVPFPEGAVLLKPQYSDSGCSEESAWTASRKLASDSPRWDWQRVESDGGVAMSGQVASCSGCHSGCMGDVCSR